MTTWRRARVEALSGIRSRLASARSARAPSFALVP